MIVPPRVRRGDTIGICVPAGPVKRERVDTGLARLGDTFKIKLAPSVTGPRQTGIPSYLAASDDRRLEELTALLADPDVRAIVLVRGGYGLMRIVSRLDPDLLRRDPKPIVGFSDATTLLSWAHHAGVRAIHGPMLAQLGELADSDVARLIDLMTDPAPPTPWPIESRGRGVIRAPLVTGNLTMASMLAGTPWALPLANAVALFEEVGERPYKIDRYLTQLALTGAIAETSAFVIGDLTRCDDPNPPSGEVDPPDAALRVILERLADRPVALGAPVGHGTRNQAVPFGAPCELDLDRGVLALLEGAVA
jgi:muramoyltetrapeptide carboxypeptidase